MGNLLPYKRNFVQVLTTRLKEKSPLIQVLLGPRQVGKTTGIEQCLAHFPDAFYATADESLSLGPDWVDAQWQHARQKKTRNSLLVIDEVQKVLHWSDRIKALWDREVREKNNFKLVLLGSSSLSLTQGIEESLTGRFEVIPVWHWSYYESSTYLKLSLDEHLLFGGYPAAAKFKNDYRRWQAYLKSSIIETVIGKDILRHANVKKPALFRQTFEILSSYPAQEISYNKLLGQLQEGGNIDLVKYYIDLFGAAFLFKTLEKYSGSTVRKKGSSPKILPMAPGLYSYQLGPDDLNNRELFGRIFESAVGAELAQLPGKLYYWREGSHEVDFVYQDGKKVFAIEVKSGRKKSSLSLEAFRKKYRSARALFIDQQNYLTFSENPENFILQNAL